jgi:hypothetical protein
MDTRPPSGSMAFIRKAGVGGSGSVCGLKNRVLDSKFVSYGTGLIWMKLFFALSG